MKSLNKKILGLCITLFILGSLLGIFIENRSYQSKIDGITGVNAIVTIKNTKDTEECKKLIEKADMLLGRISVSDKELKEIVVKINTYLNNGRK